MRINYLKSRARLRKVIPINESCFFLTNLANPIKIYDFDQNIISMRWEFVWKLSDGRFGDLFNIKHV